MSKVMSDRSDDQSEVENAAQAALIRKLVNALLVVKDALTAASEAGMIDQSDADASMADPAEAYDAGYAAGGRDVENLRSRLETAERKLDSAQSRLQIERDNAIGSRLRAEYLERQCRARSQTAAAEAKPLLDRLRKDDDSWAQPLLNEAADRIEELEAENGRLQAYFSSLLDDRSMYPTHANHELAAWEGKHGFKVVSVEHHTQRIEELERQLAEEKGVHAVTSQAASNWLCEKTDAERQLAQARSDAEFATSLMLDERKQRVAAERQLAEARAQYQADKQRGHKYRDKLMSHLADARSRAEEAERQLAEMRARAAFAWLPIETAPEYGTFLVWESRRPPVVAHRSATNPAYPDLWLLMTSIPLSSLGGYTPTHWMTVPHPPEHDVEGKPAEARDLSHGLVYPRSPTTGNGDEP